MKRGKGFIILNIIIFCITIMLIESEGFGKLGMNLLNNNYGILDMKMGYSPSEAIQMLQDLGKSGRFFYLRLLLIDCVFIVSFTVILSSIIKQVTKGIDNRYVQQFYKLAYVRAILDYIENIMIMLPMILSLYSIWWFKICSLVTCLKLITLDISVVVIIIMAIIKFIGILRRKMR